VSPYRLVCWIVWYFRYYFQRFAYIRKATLAKLAALKWAELSIYEALVVQESVMERRVLVPRLVGGFLRIKVVDDQEQMQLHGTCNSNRIRYMGRCYTFGQEPKDLTASGSFGVLVSSWGLDPLVTQLSLTYTFVRLAVTVYGEGYGDRDGAKTAGSMNVFFKLDGEGRETERPHLTPTCAEDEVGQQQYFNSHFGNDLMHCEVRRKAHILGNSMLSFAAKHNPQYMQLVGNKCSRGILTTGFIPKGSATRSLGELLVLKGPQPHPGTKKRLQSLKDLPLQASSLSRKRKLAASGVAHSYHKQPFKHAPNFGFANTSHCDTNDSLPSAQLQEWMNVAKVKWQHCHTVLNRYPAQCCVPTTCGYQFCFRDKALEADMEVRAYFSMEGLGLAMKLEHGMGHHFMGSTFSHHTSLPLCRSLSHQQISSTNSDGNFLILGWGAGKGGRKASASRRRTRGNKKGRQGT
jgi:hypothetical protein